MVIFTENRRFFGSKKLIVLHTKIQGYIQILKSHILIVLRYELLSRQSALCE